MCPNLVAERGGVDVTPTEIAVNGWRRAKFHVDAEVVPAGEAVVAKSASNARLDGDAIPRLNVGDA